MAEFITGKKLADEVYDIIFNAKKKLLIVSPYIKLDNYFKKGIFDVHKKYPEREIIIVFGKNKNNPERSFSKQDFDYFKDFPNISVVYVENLHAKYYANETKGVVTSINLYNYSFKNNVEFGVLSETKLIGGSKIDIKAWSSSMQVIEDNYAVFIKRPRFKKKFLGKDYMGSEVIVDQTDDLLNGNKLTKYNVLEYLENSLVEEQDNQRISREEFEKNNSNHNSKASYSKIPNNKNVKLLSATALGRLKNKTYKEVINTMTKNGYLSYDEITVEGAKIGITYRNNSKGDSWIVYPETLKNVL
jgi:hypothetical protein